MSVLSSTYRLSFEISPIILTGGIAPAATGGMLPIVAITEASNFTQGLLNGQISTNLDNFFAHFNVLPGSTLINDQIGKYPFANQVVAANAIIAQPLNVSLRMVCPANKSGGIFSKFMTMAALQYALQKHRAAGGTYAVCTPTFIYTGCILTNLVDITGEDGTQKQREWRWDFEQPLTTLQASQGMFNNLMQKIKSGTQITNTAWSQATPNSVGGSIGGTIGSGNIAQSFPGNVTSIPGL